MLSVIAGADARAPISYAVNPRVFVDAVRRPAMRGLRVAWGGDLGVTPVDDEVRAVARAAADTFRRLGARVEEAHPDFTGLREIVLTSRGVSMVARHADRLATWRNAMQENLVKNIDHGLTLTPSQIGRAERLRSELWERVRQFQERYDLILTPTAAVPPIPVEWRSGPKEINGQPMPSYIDWAMLTYAFTVVGLPAISVPAGFTKDGLPVGLQIVGRWRDEAGVLCAAAAFEGAQPWADRRPPEATA
jgi:amidase